MNCLQNDKEKLDRQASISLRYYRSTDSSIFTRMCYAYQIKCCCFVKFFPKLVILVIEILSKTHISVSLLDSYTTKRKEMK